MIETPRHRHDCPRCDFLGRLGTNDLYYCEHGVMPTVIARFGPDDMYISGMALAGQLAPLAEAKRRARARGLLKEPAFQLQGRALQAVLAAMRTYVPQCRRDMAICFDDEAEAAAAKEVEYLETLLDTMTRHAATAGDEPGR